MTVEPGERVLTSDGVEIGRVNQLMHRAGSPPCLLLSIERAARSDATAVVVTAADVTVEADGVRLRHISRDDLGTTGWARPGTLGDERAPSSVEGEQPATAPLPCASEEEERRG